MGCMSPFVNHSSFLFVICSFLVVHMHIWRSHTVTRVRVPFASAGGGFSQMVADRCPQLLPLVRVQPLPPDKNINKAALLSFNRRHRRQRYPQMQTQEAERVFLLTKTVTQMQKPPIKLRNGGNNRDCAAEPKYETRLKRARGRML